jgi:hypothetical protein
MGENVREQQAEIGAAPDGEWKALSVGKEIAPQAGPDRTIPNPSRKRLKP